MELHEARETFGRLRLPIPQKGLIQEKTKLDGFGVGSLTVSGQMRHRAARTFQRGHP